MGVSKKNDFPNHRKQIGRLNRIQGQIKGITKMMEEGRYCVDILIQTKAVKAAIQKVEQAILQAHIRHCIGQAAESGRADEIEEKINEIITLLDRQN